MNYLINYVKKNSSAYLPDYFSVSTWDGGREAAEGGGGARPWGTGGERGLAFLTIGNIVTNVLAFYIYKVVH